MCGWVVGCFVRVLVGVMSALNLSRASAWWGFVGTLLLRPDVAGFVIVRPGLGFCCAGICLGGRCGRRLVSLCVVRV